MVLFWLKKQNAAQEETQRKTKKSLPSERQTLLPEQERVCSPERGQETPETEVSWVHVFTRPGSFEVTQLPLPGIHMFRRTSDWLNLVLLLYKLFTR